MQPQPGDLIVWDEHIGVVESVDADGTIKTIEGNSSDQVARRTYAPGRARRSATFAWVEQRRRVWRARPRITGDEHSDSGREFVTLRPLREADAELTLGWRLSDRAARLYLPRSADR